MLESLCFVVLGVLLSELYLPLGFLFPLESAQKKQKFLHKFLEHTNYKKCINYIENPALVTKSCISINNRLGVYFFVYIRPLKLFKFVIIKD